MAGDAVLVMHGLPHSATRNESSTRRDMVYFRVTRGDRPEGELNCRPDALCDWQLEFDSIREAQLDEATERWPHAEAKL